MAPWARVTLICLGVVIAAIAVVLWVGSRRQQRALSRLVESVAARSSSESAATVDFKDLDSLPPPVAKYFRRVLREGQGIIRMAHLTQVGTLRTDVHSDRWLPFEASQIVAPHATAFVWNARVAMAPLLHVRVRDALVAGQGSGQVTFLSAVTVSAAGGNQEMNSGALHRYLAEAVWYPTALLPSAKLRWKDVDDSTALATLTDRGVTVSLEFRFNSAGEVAGIYTPARWGTFDGGYRQVPWEGHFRNYEERGGMLVPSEGEVGWHTEGVWRSVWNGRITSAVYEGAR